MPFVFVCIGLLFSMFSSRTNDGLAKLFMNISNRVGSLNFVESQRLCDLEMAASHGRFRDPKSVEESSWVEETVPKNTRYNTKWP